MWLYSVWQRNDVGMEQHYAVFLALPRRNGRRMGKRNGRGRVSIAPSATPEGGPTCPCLVADLSDVRGIANDPTYRHAEPVLSGDPHSWRHYMVGDWGDNLDGGGVQVTTKTHCGSGKHLWLDENIATNKAAGKRYCRLCANERSRAYTKARAKPKPERTHCKRGHAFTAENTRLKNGYKYCKQCHRDDNQKATDLRANGTMPRKPTIMAKPIARVAPVPQPPIVPPKVGSVELRADDKGYLARGNWRCPSSESGAHYSIIIDYKQVCRFCGAEKPLPIQGELTESLVREVRG